MAGGPVIKADVEKVKSVLGHAAVIIFCHDAPSFVGQVM
jgi:hypothetical protein